MLDLASQLRDLPARRGEPPWPGYEYVKGWGVFGLPFDSGHVLALRVFPENDFSPYRTLWHRDPGGRWSIYVDGERFDTACPRYYGPACSHVGHAHIDIEWSGLASLRVAIDAPRLEWTVEATETRTLRVLNAMSPRLPKWTWRSRPLVRARELLARRLLGLGDIRLSGTMPSGHAGILMPERMYFIAETTAVLNGEDLGRVASVDPIRGSERCGFPPAGYSPSAGVRGRSSTMRSTSGHAPRRCRRNEQSDPGGESPRMVTRIASGTHRRGEQWPR